MTTQTLQRGIRIIDLAKAFQIIVADADRTLDLAVEVFEENKLRVIENSVLNIAKRLNGDPLAKTIEAVLSHPFVSSPSTAPEVPASNGHAPHATGELIFDWKPRINPNAVLGNKIAAIECMVAGMHVEVVKLSAARYEGRIDGQTVLAGKFKKNVRERTEKETAKRANA